MTPARTATAAAISISLMIVSFAPAALGAESGSDQGKPALVMKQVEPGVQRFMRDRQGHDTTKRYPKHHRDMDHVAVTPDGTVWIASTARGDDNRLLDHFQVWPIGKRGLYGKKQGVPQGISTLMATPDGRLWAIGSGVATFDGKAWSGADTATDVKAASDDGRLWLVDRQRGGVESWDGTTFTQHLNGRWVESFMTGPDGQLWAVGESLWQLDDDGWTEMGGARGPVTLPDGSTMRIARNSGLEHVTGDETKRYLKGHYINEIALAPDGSVWAVGGLDMEENGGVYRIRPSTDS